MPSPPPAFGRARPPAQSRPPLPAKRRTAAAEPLSPPGPDEVATELQAWKQTRERQPFPWRQVSLIAGLCFGAASLILPDSVNDAAAYALYALAGISFLSALRRRRKKPS
jgi:hypothetical protein